MKVTVLLARQRSGTGALGSVLNQHPDIKYLGEVFHHQQIGAPENYFTHLIAKVRESTHYILPSAKFELFTEFMDRLGSLSERRHVVIDVKYSSMHHFNGFWFSQFWAPGFLELCAGYQFPIIHLTRKNMLKAYVSGLLAERNRVWHLRSKEEEIAVRTLTIDPIHLLRTLHGMQQEVDAIAGYLRGYERMVGFDYEDLLDDAGDLDAGIELQLRTLLDVDAFSGRRPTHLKQTDDDLRRVIENFGEVETALRGTEFAWMASDESCSGTRSVGDARSHRAAAGIVPAS